MYFVFVFLVLLYFIFVLLFFCFNLIIGRSRGRSNAAWDYVIQLEVWLRNDFLKVKHLCLNISSFG